MVHNWRSLFANARNLTQELLEALKKWLEYSSPWDAYLKTLIALEDLNQEVQLSCASSPGALQQALQKVVNTPGKNKNNSYDVEFKLSQAQRKQYLQPFINELEQIEYKNDTKLLVLVKLLEETTFDGEKAIIFCERRATVAYLVEALNTLLPSLKVFGTIQKKDDVYLTKSVSEIQRAILKFAPTANQVKKKSKNTYSVFIATDAYGVGINLQDAAVAINYDLSWTTKGRLNLGRIKNLCIFFLLLSHLIG